MNIPPIMQRLKAETRPYHDRLESSPLSTGTLMGPLSLEAYRAILSRFYGYHLPLESAFQCHAGLKALFADLPQRRKAQLLVADLLSLGAAPEEIENLPFCDQLPEIGDTAAALGAMYVIEGSTLGGQIIQRHLGSLHGLTHSRGIAFFSGYGEQTGMLWRAFAEIAGVYAEGSGAEDRIVAGAIETYETFERWLVVAHQPA